MSTQPIEDLLTHTERRNEQRQLNLAKVARDKSPEFSVLRFCDTSEEGVSKMLAWLLDPQGNHGQGSSFLELFLQWLKLDWPAGSVGKSKVRVEAPIPTRSSTRFIDVLVTSSGHALAIENKLDAKDQNRQVVDYIDWLRTHPAGYYLLYLTPDGRLPSETSIGGVDHRAAAAKGTLIVRSYAELLSWVALCHEDCGSPKVGFFIADFRDHILQTILGVADMSETARLADEIVASPTKLEAAFSLFATKSEVKRLLMAQTLARVTAECDKRGWAVLNRKLDTGARHSALAIGFSKKPKFAVGMGSDGVDYQSSFFGLTQFRQDCIESLKPGAKVTKILSSIQRCGRGGPTSYWPWWVHPAEHNYFFPYPRNFDNDLGFWMEVQNGRFADRLIEFAVEIHGQINRAGLLKCIA